jgi:hypothetical protein
MLTTSFIVDSKIQQPIHNDIPPNGEIRQDSPAGAWNQQSVDKPAGTGAFVDNKDEARVCELGQKSTSVLEAQQDPCSVTENSSNINTAGVPDDPSNMNKVRMCTR